MNAPTSVTLLPECLPSLPRLPVSEYADGSDSGSLGASSRSNLRASLLGSCHTISSAVQPDRAGSGSWPCPYTGLFQAAAQLGLPLPQTLLPGSSPPAKDAVPAKPACEEVSAGSGSSAHKRAVAQADDEPMDMVDPEYRRMRRRFTNRESAQRMRRKRQQDLQGALDKAEALRKQNARLAEAQAQAGALAAKRSAETAQWQEAARELAAENWRLKRQLVQCQVELEAAQGSVKGERGFPLGCLGLPPGPAVAIPTSHCLAPTPTGPVSSSLPASFMQPSFPEDLFIPTSISMPDLPMAGQGPDALEDLGAILTDLM